MLFRHETVITKSSKPTNLNCKYFLRHPVQNQIHDHSQVHNRSRIFAKQQKKETLFHRLAPASLTKTVSRPMSPADP